MIRILIADDHAIIRKGLRLLFKKLQDMQVVDEATDGEEVIQKLKEGVADMVILDLDMPKINGITSIRFLKQELPDVKILVFSMHPEEVYAISALKAGASGYLSKDSDTDLIIEAVNKIAKGGIFITNELAQRLAFDESRNRPGKYYKRLSSREIEVLKLLSAGKRNKEIAQELQINEKTVSTYKARLMRKLRVSNTVDLVNHAKNLEIY